MTRVEFTITLASDAEPGSGKGGELMDDEVQRDEAGRPLLRASHIKGLMRDRLYGIACALGDLRESADRLAAACFGSPGEHGEDGTLSAVGVSDAVTRQADTLLITRTAVDDLGTVKGTSLRTTEAVAVGTEWTGTLSVNAEPGGVVDLAARLALTAVEALGGGRNRGCGACWVQLEGETRSPGGLLRALLDAVRTKGVPEPIPQEASAPRATPARPSPGVWLRLTFTADSPICCPETPEVAGNAIRSGFVVPASAVQGAVLSRLAAADNDLATACFHDPTFRAWPLLPVRRSQDQDTAWVDPVRVSFSHRVSKLPLPDGIGHTFKDRSIKRYDWRDVARGSPLKAADGVLLRDASGTVRLWRASDMPRTLSAHAVHWDARGSGERNLFTVEAMAPLVWAGIAVLPQHAADALVGSVEQDPRFAFGKSRTVRGGGILRVQHVESPAIVAGNLPHELTGRVFIVQSPLALPDDWEIGTAGDALVRLVREAGWGEVQEAHATAGVRFGWNRHGLGRTVGEHHRLRARRCILPGSVVVLKQALRDLREGLVRGLGTDREGGFGALLPHPGIAGELVRFTPTLEPRRSQDTAGRIGLELWRDAGTPGPSPSQIGAVLGHVRQDARKALEYLERQRDRGEAGWRRWAPVIQRIEALLKAETSAVVARALRVWQDLAVVNRSQEDR